MLSQMMCWKKVSKLKKFWGRNLKTQKISVSCFCAENDLCNKKKKQRTYFPTKSLGVVTLNLKKKHQKMAVCLSLPFAWTQLAMVFFWVALTMSPGTMISFSFVSKGGGLSSHEILMPRKSRWTLKFFLDRLWSFWQFFFQEKSLTLSLASLLRCFLIC